MRISGSLPFVNFDAESAIGMNAGLVALKSDLFKYLWEVRRLPAGPSHSSEFAAHHFYQRQGPREGQFAAAWAQVKSDSFSPITLGL